ncbi:MAG: hypothetical protein CL814_11920 [Confluentimicrobium sp.]|jgi:hypothetical protein|uniref:hypothetical protein n=1 Tax=Actibacterium sp. TaxID=1872125 RepID=UPI00050ED2AC|nr:hypothetical protein [Actibacterium sp.]KGB82568.1 hypothetical protein JT55_07105 [Rhodovulum sp. NI22]MBC57624.1 hypothetical protein [Actibacterium sp.]|tara:strand:+ start:2743 stop:2925 length:183 start_codon:yes stop_codon:yes gene_type:complete
MNPRWFLRMARWARNPPGEKRVKLVLGVIALCLALLAVERFVGWPDWLTVNGTPDGRLVK